MTTYQNLPVFPIAADLSRSVKRSLRYEPEEASFGFGDDPAVPVQSTTRERLEFHCFAESSDVLNEVESFFENNRGRFKSFWVPTGLGDFDVEGSQNLTSFLVRDVGHRDNWQSVFGSHLQFKSSDGNYHFRKIIDIALSSYPGFEVVTLDSALPSIPASDWLVSL